MSSTKRYWKDLGELNRLPEVTKAQESEFPEPLPIDQVLSDKGFAGATTGRRDFLKFLGFSLGAASLAACETPVIKSIPYVNKPEEITPGVANWYASTYYDGTDFASILVKTREGRPIHIQGNPRLGINRDPQLTSGVINARINSSVLGLYDGTRLRGPMMRHGENDHMTHSWADADKAIMGKLDEIGSKGGRVVLLTPTVISPSSKAAIEKFRMKYSTELDGGDGLLVTVGAQVEHVQYDTISYSGVTNANARCFGMRVMPSYDLTKADVLVGIDCDLLSSWGSPLENSWQYARRRRPENGPMSRHWQFESRMSITGANADERVAIKPSEVPGVVIALHDAVAKKVGAPSIGGGADMTMIAGAAEELLAAKGRCLVLCGTNEEGVQTVVDHINWMLGNYGSTIDLANHNWFHQGDDAAMARLVADMQAGKIAALIMHGVNPVYSLPNGAGFRDGMSKVGLTVSMSDHADETANACDWICPDHHFLESWNDHMPKVGRYTLTQPTIRPLFDTRQWQDSLLRWAGAQGDHHALIRETWKNALAGRADAASMPPFETVWDRSLAEGGFDAYTASDGELTFNGDLQAAAAMARKAAEGAGEWEVVLYTKESIGNGLHANNPWLQEMPDPLTKVTWDNYICMHPSDMQEMGLNVILGQERPASLATITVNGSAIDLPVVAAPGQKPRTVSVALGYGRGANGEAVGRAACLMNDDGEPVPVGRNAYPFTALLNGSVSYSALSATIAATGGTYPIAMTQTHLTAMDREGVLRETELAVWEKHDPKNTYNPPATLPVHADVNEDGEIDARDREDVSKIDLWEEFGVEQEGHRWGMSIDLNACTGCGACITACTSENNVPVVGKDEVRRSREMHWLRLDRYYSTDMSKEKAEEEGLSEAALLARLEVPSEMPQVDFMPVMCQHCNTPASSVPVAATAVWRG
ncbi:MAG: TAT-variant-translocated molybdopterin oxidoreductase [Flavobacteriales bacterium]|nr:TAT-variant-translocated molybdopterin oxidoreductase [Flavobacteriales bacterium]